MNISNLKEWSLSGKELAYYAPTSGPTSASSLQLFIPKIFATKSRGIPKISSPSSLNSSCLLNDSSCKPAVSKTYRTQNYLTVKKHDNSEFELPWFHAGDQLYVEVMHNNIDTLRVTNYIDNSHLYP